MRMRAAQRQHHHAHHGAPHHSASTSALPNHTQQNGAQGKPVPWRASAGMGGKPASQQHPHQAAPVMPPGLSGVSAAAAAGAAAGAAAAAAAVAAGGELGAPPGLPAPGGASAPVSIPARPSASGSSGGGALVGSAHGSSPAAAWAGASSLDAARKEANKVSESSVDVVELKLSRQEAAAASDLVTAATPARRLLQHSGTGAYVKLQPMSVVDRAPRVSRSTRSLPPPRCGRAS